CAFPLRGNLVVRGDGDTPPASPTLAALGSAPSQFAKTPSRPLPQPVGEGAMVRFDPGGGSWPRRSSAPRRALSTPAGAAAIVGFPSSRVPLRARGVCASPGIDAICTATHRRNPMASRERWRPVVGYEGG